MADVFEFKNEWYLDREWYEDNQVDEILNRQQKLDDGKAIKVGNNTIVRPYPACNIVDPADDVVLGMSQLVDFIKESFKKNPAPTHFVCPFNLGNSHWVTLAFDVSNRSAPAVQMIDSMRSGGDIKDWTTQFNAALRKEGVIGDNSAPLQTDFTSASALSLAVQTDGYNCGPWAVEITKMLMDEEGENYWANNDKADWIKNQIKALAKDEIGGTDEVRQKAWITRKRWEQQKVYAPERNRFAKAAAEKRLPASSVLSPAAAAVPAPAAGLTTASSSEAYDPNAILVSDEPTDPYSCFSLFGNGDDKKEKKFFVPKDFFGNGIPANVVTRMTMHSVLEMLKYGDSLSANPDEAKKVMEAIAKAEGEGKHVDSKFQPVKGAEGKFTYNLPATPSSGTSGASGATAPAATTATATAAALSATTTAGTSPGEFSYTLDEYYNRILDKIPALLVCQVKQDPYLAVRLEELHQKKQILRSGSHDIWGGEVNYTNVVWDMAYKTLEDEHLAKASALEEMGKKIDKETKSNELQVVILHLSKELLSKPDLARPLRAHDPREDIDEVYDTLDQLRNFYSELPDAALEEEEKRVLCSIELSRCLSTLRVLADKHLALRGPDPLGGFFNIVKNLPKLFGAIQAQLPKELKTLEALSQCLYQSSDRAASISSLNAELTEKIKALESGKNNQKKLPAQTALEIVQAYITKAGTGASNPEASVQSVDLTEGVSPKLDIKLKSGSSVDPNFSAWLQVWFGQLTKHLNEKGYSIETVQQSVADIAVSGGDLAPSDIENIKQAIAKNLVLDNPTANLASPILEKAKEMNTEIAKDLSLTDQPEETFNPLNVVQAIVEWEQLQGYADSENKFSSTTKESSDWKPLIEALETAKKGSYGVMTAGAIITAIGETRLPFGLDGQKDNIIAGIFGCDNKDVATRKANEEFAGASAEFLNEFFTGAASAKAYRKTLGDPAALKTFKTRSTAAKRWMSEDQASSVIDMFVTMGAETPTNQEGSLGNIVPFFLGGELPQELAISVWKAYFSDKDWGAIKKTILSFLLSDDLFRQNDGYETKAERVATDWLSGIKRYSVSDRVKMFKNLYPELQKQMASREGIEAAIETAFPGNDFTKRYLLQQLKDFEELERSGLEKEAPGRGYYPRIQAVTQFVAEMPKKVKAEKERLAELIGGKMKNAVSRNVIVIKGNKQVITSLGELKTETEALLRKEFEAAVQEICPDAIVRDTRDSKRLDTDYSVRVAIDRDARSPKFEYQSAANVYAVDPSFLTGGSLGPKQHTKLAHLFRMIAATAAAAGQTKMSIDKLVKMKGNNVDTDQDLRVILKAYLAICRTEVKTQDGEPQAMKVTDSHNVMKKRLSDFNLSQARALIGPCRDRFRALLDDQVKEVTYGRLLKEINEGGREIKDLEIRNWLKSKNVRRLLFPIRGDGEAMKMTLEEVATVMKELTEKRDQLAKALKPLVPPATVTMARPSPTRASI